MTCLDTLWIFGREEEALVHYGSLDRDGTFVGSHWGSGHASLFRGLYKRLLVLYGSLDRDDLRRVTLGKWTCRILFMGLYKALCLKRTYKESSISILPIEGFR